MIYVSRDNTQEEFNDHFETMPWVALPFGDDRIIEFKTQHKIQKVPTLLVLTKKGTLLSEIGRNDVIEKGEDVFI